MLDARGLRELLEAMAERIRQNREWLTELDAAIGDADHGINMDKGFTAVLERVKEDHDISKMLRDTGMVLLSTVGGASGPLYGTAFLRAAQVVAGKDRIAAADLPAVLEAALAGIKQRGRAERGEKTIVDALEPALDSLRSALEEGRGIGPALAAAVAAAEEGVAFTKTIRATKGRASYLGERSIGHQDPGATSCYLLLDTLHRYVDGGKQG